MKKVFSKIVLLLTVLSLLFAATACSDATTPPKAYTQSEVLAEAVQNTLKEQDIKVRGAATVYVAPLGKNVPVTVTADIKNQNGKVDFTVQYEGTATVLGQPVRVGNAYTYKDGILYTPAYNENGEIIEGAVNSSMVDLSLDDLLNPSGEIGAMLSALTGALAAESEIVRPQNGVYTLGAQTNLQLALQLLQQFVCAYADVPLGDMLASFAGEGYERSDLVADLEKIFGSPTVAGIAKNANALLARFGLPITVGDIANVVLDQMGYTKTDVYYMLKSIDSLAPIVARPTAKQTTYEYAMSYIGPLPTKLVEEKLGFSLAEIGATVLAYLDNDDCLFGMLWDMAAGYFDEALFLLGMLTGTDAQIAPPFLSCENLSKYVVNACAGALTLGIDAATMRVSALSFTVDFDVAFEQDEIKSFVLFDGTVTYGEAVTVEVPDAFIYPCIEAEEIDYGMLAAGAPWESALPVRVFVGSCETKDAFVRVYEDGEATSAYAVTFEDGMLLLPADLLNAAYENNVCYEIELALPINDEYENHYFVLTVVVNPKYDISVSPASLAA